jgi:predicted nucleic-acid-binding Zn-ribbon protein
MCKKNILDEVNVYMKFRRCIKCGHRKINDEFIGSHNLTTTLSVVKKFGRKQEDQIVQRIPPFIKRTCAGCGYEFVEKPLDYKAEDYQTGEKKND